MRVFESENFPQDATEALTETHRFECPSQTVEEAVQYVQQFLTGPIHSKELLRGYLPTKYTNALVEYRDTNDSYELNSAVNRLCVNGQCSQPVQGYSDFVEIEIPASIDVSKRKHENYADIESKEARKNSGVLSEMVASNQGTIQMYVPRESAEELRDVGIIQ